jgi:hypothetical protein
MADLVHACVWYRSSFCHRFVGYLEEEAVRTYTHLLHDLDAGKLPEWKDAPAPDIARQYWKMVRLPGA